MILSNKGHRFFVRMLKGILAFGMGFFMNFDDAFVWRSGLLFVLLLGKRPGSSPREKLCSYIVQVYLDQSAQLPSMIFSVKAIESQHFQAVSLPFVGAGHRWTVRPHPKMPRCVQRIRKRKRCHLQLQGDVPGLEAIGTSPRMFVYIVWIIVPIRCDVKTTLNPIKQMVWHYVKWTSTVFFHANYVVWITCFRFAKTSPDSSSEIYLPKASRGTPPATWFRRGADLQGIRLASKLRRESPNWQEKYHLYTTYSPCLLGGYMLATTFYGNHFNNHWNDSHLFFPRKKNEFPNVFWKINGLVQFVFPPLKWCFVPLKRETNSFVFGGFSVNKVEARWWNFNRAIPTGKMGYAILTCAAYFSNGWQKKNHQVEQLPPLKNLTWQAGKSTMTESMYGSYWKWVIFQQSSC